MDTRSHFICLSSFFVWLFVSTIYAGELYIHTDYDTFDRYCKVVIAPSKLSKNMNTTNMTTTTTITTATSINNQEMTVKENTTFCDFLKSDDSVKVMKVETPNLQITSAKEISLEPTAGLIKITLKNSENIMTLPAQGHKNKISLVIQNSSASLIKDFVNDILLIGSNVGKLHLVDANDFDIQNNSKVETLTGTVVGTQSGITDSEIVNIQNLDLSGKFRFYIESSKIQSMKNFVYNSKFTNRKMNSTLKDTTIETIHKDGLTIESDTILNFKNMNISEVESNGIKIKGVLKIENSRFKYPAPDSIVLQENGKLEMNSVFIFNNFFTFSMEGYGGDEYYPLKSLVDEEALWKLALICVGAGFCTGLLISAIYIIYYNCQNKQNNISELKSINEDAKDTVEVSDDLYDDTATIFPNEAREMMDKVKSHNNKFSKNKFQKDGPKNLSKVMVDNGSDEEHYTDSITLNLP